MSTYEASGADATDPIVTALAREYEQQVLDMSRRAVNRAVEKAGAMEIAKNLENRVEQAEARAAALQAELDTLKGAPQAASEVVSVKNEEVKQ